MLSHRDIMVNLAIDNDWRRGIELGLGSGLLFARFLALKLNMIGVDIGARADRKKMVCAIANGNPQAKVYWMSTHIAALYVPDGWADFVFIDAGHNYEAVRQDIADWQAKVRPGGWFGGHDYHPSHPGVIRAVDEAFGGGISLHGEAIWSRI